LGLDDITLPPTKSLPKKRRDSGNKHVRASKIYAFCIKRERAELTYLPIQILRRLIYRHRPEGQKIASPDAAYIQNGKILLCRF
jgi:hypothetical protein